MLALSNVVSQKELGLLYVEYEGTIWQNFEVGDAMQMSYFGTLEATLYIVRDKSIELIRLN